MTGIDGNYKMTCESVMEVLREHKDSLMAVLEAFVYDPLLNWRLMDSKYPSTYTIIIVSINANFSDFFFTNYRIVNWFFYKDDMVHGTF